MSDVENYLASYFNYSKKTSWNINTVKNSLKATKPVLIYGKPDNIATDGVTPFILDGIKECYGRIDNVPSDVDVCYLHANFWLRKRLSGWLLFNGYKNIDNNF